MRVRHPPGRAGRPWLTHRLVVARRGAGLLDEKQRALVRERRRLEPLVAQAADEWMRQAAEAERRLARALVLGGQRQLEAAAAGAIPPAQIHVRWRTVLGVTCPADAAGETHSDPQLSARGGSAALLAAVEAHRQAVEAAARLGVAAGALRRIDAELRATSLRRNAIERRWIPAHEAALTALDMSLEETERDEAIGIHWISSRTSHR